MGLLSLIRGLFFRKATLSFHDFSCRYDGKQHAATFDIQGLSKHHRFEILNPPSFTHCAKYAITLTRDEMRIINSSGKDVSKQYEIEVIPGTAIINPVELTVSSASQNKIYDGTPLTAEVVNIDGLVAGESLAARALGTITNVGSTENIIDIDWGSSSARQKNYVITKLPGALTVEPAPLEISCADTTVTYDGRYHEPQISAPDDVLLCFSGPDRFIHAGSYEVEFTAAKPNHTTAACTAHLTITPAPLRISSLSASKQYDGNELTAPTLQVEGLAPSDSLVARATGALANVGSITNDVTFDWENSSANRNDYDINLDLGTLTITPATIEIKASYKRVVYNGAPHSFEIDMPVGASVKYDTQKRHISVGTYRTKYHVSMPNHQTACGIAELEIIEYPDPIVVTVVGGQFEYDGSAHHAQVLKPQLPDGYSLVKASSSAKITHVDESPVVATCDNLTIVNLEGTDVTDRLRIIYHKANLIVTPKPLYVFTLDAKCHYTGRALTAKGRLSGLCSGETVTFKTTGSQITEGKGKNTYSLTFNGTALETDYKIIESLGNLTVLPPSTPSSAIEQPCSEFQVAPSAQSQSQQHRADSPSKTPAPHQNETPKQVKSKTFKQNQMASITFPENRFTQIGLAQIEWSKPKVINSHNTSRHGSLDSTPERKHAYSARTVSLRDNLDDAGLGHGYRPYDFDAPSLNSNKPLRDRLRDAEANASACINSLFSTNKNLLLYECFEYGIENELCFVQTFQSLFAFFSYDQRLAISYIFRHNASSFILLVALLARDCFDGKSLWDRVFASVGLDLPDAQTKFKQTFISLMHQSGLVTYQREKNHTYIAYTAILHGGFSRAIWDDLWAHSFIPMAQDKALPNGSRGPSIVETVLNSPAYIPHMSITKNLLQKAPHAALLEPFEAALNAAYSVCSQWKHSEISIVPSHELSSGALSSLGSYTQLDNTVKDETAGKKKTRKMDDVDWKPAPKAKSIFISKAMELSLDTSRGVAQLTWVAQPAPSTMKGSKLELYVNGSLAHSVFFEPDIGCCSLPAGAIELKPQEQYDTELVIKKPTSDGAWQEVASIRQDYHKNKPYCFEFIRQQNGRYSYRKPDTSLSNTHRIAYLTPSHIGIRGIRGMSLVDSIAAQNSWSQMNIYTYDVDAGAAGELYDLNTNEILSGWKEDYRVRIDKTNVIGNIGSTDVYGHMLGMGETDVALPSITIDTFAKHAAEDIEVRFIREGKKSTLDAVLTLNDENDSGSLALKFPSNELGRGVASSCIIEARQHTTGDLLLRYRFAIVPIQGFRLEDYKISPVTNELIGIYELSVTEPVTIKYSLEEDIERSIESGAPSNVEAPLCLESVQTKLQDSQGASITFDLHLAGIEVKVPELLRTRAKQLPYIGYPSVKTLGFVAGDIVVSAKGRRRERHVKVMLGNALVGERRFDKAGTSAFNIFANPDLFTPVPGTSYISMPLTIHISFGRKMEHGDIEKCVATYNLLECGRGLEFTVCDIRTTNTGTSLCFDNKYQGSIPSCDIEVDFFDSRGKSIATARANKGNRIVRLPSAVKDLYDRRRDVTVSICMKSGFGIVDQNHPVQLHFNRSRRNRS